MVKKFKKLRDFVSKNKKYLSLYLFLIGISIVVDSHPKSLSKDYNDYTLLAIRNKSNHFVNGYLITSLGRSLFFVIQNIINPINKFFPIVYIFRMCVTAVILLNSESKFKDLLINTIFYNILQFIIILSVLKLRIGNDFFREKITYNGGWFQYFNYETGEIIKRDDKIITFNRNVALKFLIPTITTSLIVGLRKIYEL